MLFFPFLGISQFQNLDSENSFVNFEIGGIAWTNVGGKFEGIQGDVLLDTNNLALSYFNVCIESNSINTGSKKRDEHLKNEDFFIVKSFPRICFDGKKIIKTPSGYSVTGKLTMLGVVKEVSIPFTTTINSNQLVLRGEFKVNRFDFGLASKSYSSTAMVGKEAEIKVVCVLKK